MSRHAPAVIAAFALASALLFAQARPSSTPVQGVWRVQERTVTGANPSKTTTPQPGIYIFTARHYSLVAIPGASPRPKVDATPTGQGANVTDAQKLAIFPQWLQFQANSGTYEVKGTTLTTKPIVAKNETVMAGPGATYQFKVDGNMLWLTNKTPDGKSTTELKLARLE
jgi:hypothetical protein